MSGCDNQKSKNLIVIASIILLAFLCTGLCWEAIYSLPEGDDFGYFYLMKKGLEDGNSPIQSAVRIVDIYYQDWSGDYVSVFLVPFLNPFYLFGLRGISIFCLVGVVLFFVIIFFFIQSLKKTLLSTPYSLGGTLLFLIPIAGWLDSFTPKEIFYWYTCVYSYCLGLILVLLISIFMIEKEGHVYEKRKRTFFLIPLFLLGLLSAGISIQTMTISIGTFVFFALAGLLRDKWQMISLGSGIMISAVIVLFAPGNHVRGAGDSTVGDSAMYRLLTSLVDSTRCIARMGWKQILTSPFFWLFVVTVVIFRLNACMFKKYELTGKTLIKRLIGSVILVYSAVIPVCYGYQTSFLSPRTECIAGFIIWILLIYWVLLLSQMIPLLSVSSRNKKIMMNSTLVGVGILFIIFFLCGDNAGVLAYKELMGGKPQTQWDNWNYIFNTVAENTDSEMNISIYNEHITDTMIRNPETEHDGKIVISRSYMAYANKDRLIINWIAPNSSYTLYGEREPLSIDWR